MRNSWLFGWLLVASWMITTPVFAQEEQEAIPQLPLKILHAEPLYIDLIRDLGAHKGEREWNVGAALVDRKDYNSYEMLIEYEWAVMDRWGLEVEVPVTIHRLNRLAREENANITLPSNRIESLKLATQYTFLVSGKYQTSLAVGGIVEWEFTDLNRLNSRNAFEGVLLNPFFIAAKRWGADWHSLIYTGPRLHRHFHRTNWQFGYEVNTNIHYMIPGSRHFIGVELNKLLDKGHFNMIIRPQMRLILSEALMIGIVPGIPVKMGNDRMSTFVRLIYEPPHRQKH
jgi:hypothetical protein